MTLPAGWREANGVVTSPDAPAGDPTYSDELRAWIAKIEPEHFWFTSRAVLIAAIVERFVPPEGWLELGCGNGFVLREVQRRYAGPCFGQEVAATALALARARTDARLFHCGPGEVPVRDIGGVGLLDVIEHLADDVAALRGAARYVRPGGAVVVSVPAHQWLWSDVDEASGHQRRYSRAALIAAMTAAGLRVEWCRPFFLSLLPGLIVRRGLRAPTSDALLHRAIAPPPPVINTVFRWLTRAESAATRAGLLPAGTSWLAVGRTARA
ncbi:MAG: class I SAM-dependent methyltransferase [Acidobacteriia bacterium]|nr:class I SAM-dependent methyltransferase [Terriglobia bacterium]